jgi:hypothetical protein
MERWCPEAGEQGERIGDDTRILDIQAGLLIYGNGCNQHNRHKGNAQRVGTEEAGGTESIVGCVVTGIGTD